MQCALKNRILKASTLVEVVTALTILLIISFLFFQTLLKVEITSNPYEEYKIVTFIRCDFYDTGFSFEDRQREYVVGSKVIERIIEETSDEDCFKVYYHIYDRNRIRIKEYCYYKSNNKFY